MTEPRPMAGEADLEIDELDRRQRPWCRYRVRCLNAIGRAPSLDCRGCCVEQSVMDREQLNEEIRWLAALGVVVNKLANTPADRLPLLMQPRKRTRAA